MSILSSTLTRYYTTRTTEKFAFLLWYNETLHARARGSKLTIEPSPRVTAKSRTSSREICLTRYHPVPLYPATTSIDLPGTNRSLSPRRTVRFLVMLCDTREIIREYAVRITERCIAYLLVGTVSFLILTFPSPSFSENTSPPWTNDTRDDERAGERGFFAPRL